MTDSEKKKAAEAFAKKWLANEGSEKQDTHPFWIDLLHDVFGITRVTDYIEFEKRVTLANSARGYIDGYISSVPVLIEQKGRNIDIRKKERQSDGAVLDPHEQAKRYVQWLPRSQKPKYIVVCNFDEFLIYDEENPVAEPQSVMTRDLGKEFYRLDFLIDPESRHQQKEQEISIKAGEAVGKIYDALRAQYPDPDSPSSLRSLNILCVRLVFCLYAEDSGIFGRLQFGSYLSQYNGKTARHALIDLFEVLDTPIDKRDPNLDDDVKAFPYVNGGLFADEDIEIPRFTDELVHLIADEVSAGIDWSDISPTIFGGVFESTLNVDTRRSGGMHYTSVENIHKVIDPLFLDDLKAEFTDIIDSKNQQSRRVDALERFKTKLSGLIFLDPACGSGNFLTETYLSLRRLENRAIAEIIKETYGQMIPFEGTIKGSEIKVSIGQFYGIEINDFAVSVAKTALWIAEHQMLEQTRRIVRQDRDFLPLTSYANIVEGNALRLDWETVVPKDRLNYIMGNPPFMGQSIRNKEQSDDMAHIFGKGAIETKLDYVICWYKIALDYINQTANKISVAFVSTNSICQGEAVPTFWKYMCNNGAEIQFAHTSFIWNSEANEMAHVHCVIVGFSKHNTNKKHLYNGNEMQIVDHINGYLLNAPDIWIANRINSQNADFPKMTTGSPPTDDGGLLLTIEEKEYFETKYPSLTKYIRPFIGAKEFLHDRMGYFSRYCFWFVNANPADYAKINEIDERFEKIKALRLNSNADRINKMADYPSLFCQNRQPDKNYLVFPRHSSEKRKYIPIGFMTPDIIAGDACSIVPNVSIYEFGLLTSIVHMEWVRVTCGRLKSDYRYSPAVYNNFPRCTPTDKQREKIEQTAQAILDVRATYPDSCLADLYKETAMPPELRKAHNANDNAVMQAYGFKPDMAESEIVAELMKMYKALTE